MKDFPKQKHWRLELKRMQHYLGLLTGLQSYQREDDSASKTGLPVVLVSIDLEAFEFNQNIITEVGISTLCGSDICNMLPGPNGQNWISKIHARHFRVAETKHLVNRKHVEGCPENFEFGQSEMISRHDLTQFLHDFFCSLPHWSNAGEESLCKVVLVGHSVDSDLKYLNTLGFDPTLVISDCIDTMDLNRVVCRNPRQLSLGKLLLQNNLPNHHLHNAGNDACYTLQAAIAMSVDSILNGKTAEHWQSGETARIKKAVEEAITRTTAEFDGWSSSDDDEEEIRAQIATPVKEVPQNRQKSQSSVHVRQTATHVKNRDNRRRLHPPSIDGTLHDSEQGYNPNNQDVSRSRLTRIHTPPPRASYNHLGAEHCDFNEGRRPPYESTRGRYRGPRGGRGRGTS